jgi:YVTN family beta-propeller protein
MKLLAVIAASLPGLTLAAPFAYVSNRLSSDVSVVDIATNAVVATTPVTGLPVGVAVNRTGTRAYVANSMLVNNTISTVSVIDTATNSVIANVPIGQQAYGIAVNPAGTRVYVTNTMQGNNTVSVMDATTYAVIATVPVGICPISAAVDPSGARVYVTNGGSDSVSVINATTNAVVATVGVGAGPVGVAVNAAGTRVYVANQIGNTVSVIDTATLSVIATMPVGQSPMGVAVDAAGALVYVVNQVSQNVSIISAATNQVVGMVAVASNPRGISLNPAGTRAYVTNYGSDNISVIDTASRTVVATVPVGDGPYALGQFIVPGTAVPTAVRSDIGGDGRSDIVWRNVATGDVNAWMMNGRALLPGSRNFANIPSADWTILGVGDFDGDGKADLLWRNTYTGDVNAWFMDGTALKPTSGNITAISPSLWQFLGIGDVNGDNKADILWRNASTGEVYVWLMSGLALQAGSGRVATAATNLWTFAGIGDLDGDGKADLVWRNMGTGEVSSWLMNGPSVKASSGTIGTLSLSQWQVAGVGDVDGDGMADVVLRDVTNGDVHVWLMSGRTIRAGSGYVGNAPPTLWNIVGMGDFDGDGKFDLLWRSSNNDINTWLMSATGIKAGSGTIANVGTTSWVLVKP